MPYAQIDVSAPRHRKVSTLSHAAFRLWVVSLCYAQEHLTDGVIHSEVVPALLPGFAVEPGMIDELVRRGLWDKDPDNGWRVHDYLTWNESRARVEERRAKWRRRRTGSTPTERTQGTHPSVHGTLRSDPLRSTDQDQERKSTRLPAGPHPRLRTTNPDEPPKPALLAKIASEILKLDPTLAGADLKEAVKAQAARLRVAYDGDSIRQALDGVQGHQTRRLTARRVGAGAREEGRDG